jgi:hypothetical protein
LFPGVPIVYGKGYPSFTEGVPIVYGKGYPSFTEGVPIVYTLLCWIPCIEFPL